jgi:hypothetical protein
LIEWEERWFRACNEAGCVRKNAVEFRVLRGAFLISLKFELILMRKSLVALESMKHIMTVSDQNT